MRESCAVLHQPCKTGRKLVVDEHQLPIEPAVAACSALKNTTMQARWPQKSAIIGHQAAIIQTFTHI